MTEPKPEPSLDTEPQNPAPEPAPAAAADNDQPVLDPNALMAGLAGFSLADIENDIESAFGSRMAELDKMLEGLDSLVAKIESDIQNLDQPKQDGTE